MRHREGGRLTGSQKVNVYGEERQRGGEKSIEMDEGINVCVEEMATEERREKMMKYYRKRKVTEGWELQ